MAHIQPVLLRAVKAWHLSQSFKSCVSWQALHALCWLQSCFRATSTETRVLFWLQAKDNVMDVGLDAGSGAHGDKHRRAVEPPKISIGVGEWCSYTAPACVCMHTLLDVQLLGIGCQAACFAGPKTVTAGPINLITPAPHTGFQQLMQQTC